MDYINCYHLTKGNRVLYTFTSIARAYRFLERRAIIPSKEYSFYKPYSLRSIQKMIEKDGFIRMDSYYFSKGKLNPSCDAEPLFLH